jgi:WD40 repeat protein
MGPAEIKALQQRLTDAGCYKAAIDGVSGAPIDTAIKSCPDQQAFLRIETGMHTAPITRIGVDDACRLLATASWDKTVRLWSLPDGKLKRVVRLPIGEGHAGKLFAAALSRDGRWLAAGGYDATWDKMFRASLTVVDLSNGAIRRFGSFEQVIDSVAFSPDRRRIAVGLYGKSGVRVLDSETGAELFADRNYGDTVYGLTFTPAGALITSSFDGQLRRYGLEVKPMLERSAPDGRHPYHVAIDPSGRRLAVGYDDTTAVSILDADTLTPLASAQAGDLTEGNLFSVAWSRDGGTLVAGGLAQAQFKGKWDRFLRRFDVGGARAGADVAASDDTILDIQRCGEGFVFAAADPSFGLLSPLGVAKTLQNPRTADLRDKVGTAFAVSAEASLVRFGLGDRELQPVIFDLASASLKDSPNLPSDVAVARVDGLPVTDWHDNYAPKFKGGKLALEDYEMSRAMAVRPGAPGFVLGADFSVRAFDANGKQLWGRPGPGVAWGVDFSADGDIIVVAFTDGTIRWLRWKDGKELLAFFVERQSRKWVAWTPTGYYMASAGGEDLIGWHVNRGWGQEADFFPASQFRAQYNRPDIVRLVLKTRDEAEAIRQANSASDHTAQVKSVAAGLPPVAKIVSPVDGSYFTGNSVEIAYALRSPSGLPIDGLDVLADGQRVPTAGFETVSSPEAQGRVTVTLPPKDTVVTLIARSGDLTSAPVTVTLEYRGTSTAERLKPKLYALLVGVTGYQNHNYDNLQFPGRDAEALAEVLDRQKGGLFADVQIKIVDVPTNDDLKAKIASSPNWDDPNVRFMGLPSRDNVIAGLYWLQRAATSRDLSVIFLSGHGVRDAKQNFWFLTREANLAQLRNTAISNDDLLDTVTSVPGKKVLFIDACHAGAALPVGIKSPEAHPDMNKLVNDFTTINSGVVVYAASTGTEVSYEDAKWDRHGAFAKALVDAIGEGKASIDPSGRITTDMLDLYLADHVKEMTKDEETGVQHPVMNRPGPIPDFPLALAKP